MTDKELMAVFEMQVPVEFTVYSMPCIAIKADRIESVLIRLNERKEPVPSAQILDKNGGCLWQVPSRNVRYIRLEERFESLRKGKEAFLDELQP